MTGGAIAHQIDTGRWLVADRGVFRLVGAPRTWEADLIAAVLAAGPAAAASHRSAAALLGISGFTRSGPPEVTTPRPRRHRSPDHPAHRWRPFPDHHLTTVEGIVTTRVARTLIDLAGLLHPARTERIVDDCIAGRTVTVETIRSTFDEMASRGRRGIAVMRKLLEEREAGAHEAPASELEARFIAVVRNAGLPDPVRQLDLGDGERWLARVDFAYPEARLVVELDGRRYHDTKIAIEQDQRRDQVLVAAGWRVIRVRWAQLDQRPEEITALLRRLVLPNPANPGPPVDQRIAPTAAGPPVTQSYTERPETATSSRAEAKPA